MSTLPFVAFSERLVMPLRGVNLGGWLVLEPWLTPSLFKGTDAVDEFSYCTGMNTAGLRRLRQHYREFITEPDFAWLAEQGIEAVRLPIGYWLFGDVMPYQATFPYVERALKWAKKYNLKVLLDLHGAPGSQNGKMHSGHKGEINWSAAETLHILERLAKKYGRHPALLGISLLNEPIGLKYHDLHQFYRDAYQLLRPLCKNGSWFVFSDAFRPRHWFYKLRQPQLSVDYHHYQIFSWFDKLLSARWQLWRAQHVLPGRLRRMAKHHPLVVGEWSLALRSEKLAALSATQQQILTKRYGEAQLSALQASRAWFYWTYKTENGDSWSYRDCVERGIL